ncbi:ATP synthase F1 subunit delta [Patescibacteria group bacterium]
MKTTAKQYAQVLYDLIKGKNQDEVDVVVLKFAQELRNSRKMKMARKIIETFNDIYNKENGIIEAEAVSARELSGDQMSKISEFLKNKYEASEIILDNKVEKSIVGGLIIKAGDDVIDGSVSGKVENLRKSLLR